MIASNTSNIKHKPWPVRTLGLFLIGQSIVLISLGSFYFKEQGLPEWRTLETILQGSFDNLFLSVAFIALSLLALITSISFPRLWYPAWVNAMLLQGLCLLLCLVLYFNNKPNSIIYSQFTIYGGMLYSIFMVIYLHHPEVQLAFHIRQKEGTPL